MLKCGWQYFRTCWEQK